MDSQLKFRQKAGERVEAQMLQFLIGFIPVEELKVGDMKCIARFARTIAFDEFAPDKPV